MRYLLATAWLAWMLTTAALAGAQPRSEGDGAFPNPLAVVYFGMSSTSLGEDDRRALEGPLAWLGEHPRRVLIVEGHADPRGSASANLLLSQRRADSVRNALVARGISPHRVVVAGYGETEMEAAGADRARSRTVVVNGSTYQVAMDPQ